jgi:RNA polymerase sigma factor (sigma-70 family)
MTALARPLAREYNPPPLTEGQKALAARYWRFARWVAGPYKRHWPHLADEMESAAAWALMRCVRRYACEAEFTTYARQAISLECRAVCRDSYKRKNQHERLGDGAEFVGDHRSQDTSRVDDADEIRHRLKWATDDERRLLILRYFHGLTQIESASVMGITYKTVRRRQYAVLARLAQHTNN